MKKLTSSTSNFEFNELETTPRNGGVFAVSVVIFLIFCIELTLWNTRQWFSDQAAWYWSEKQSLVDDGQMGAEVVFIGTSVTFHGIDTETLNEGLTPKNQFSNLSLNGLTLQYQTQVLNEYIASNGSPDEVVLELRECCVTPQSWKNGPAWRFWMSNTELMESGFYFWKPGVIFDFYASRVLASYAYRKSLDNWIFKSARLVGLSRAVFDRNGGITNEMEESRGFAKGTFDAGLQEDPPKKSRPFKIDRSGQAWLNRLLETCRKNQIKVTIFSPPVPESVALDRLNAAYNNDYEKLISNLNSQYPELEIRVFKTSGYPLSCFADDHHLSHAGAQRVTKNFMTWWQHSTSRR